jgi:hypothetical protein
MKNSFAVAAALAVGIGIGLPQERKMQEPGRHVSKGANRDLG